MIGLATDYRASLTVSRLLRLRLGMSLRVSTHARRGHSIILVSARNGSRSSRMVLLRTRIRRRSHIVLRDLLPGTRGR